jgi:hypothetical protein
VTTYPPVPDEYIVCVRGGQNVLVLAIPFDLRRSLWSEVSRRSSQRLTVLRAPLNAHKPTNVIKREFAIGGN